MTSLENFIKSPNNIKPRPQFVAHAQSLVLNTYQAQFKPSSNRLVTIGKWLLASSSIILTLIMVSIILPNRYQAQTVNNDLLNMEQELSELETELGKDNFIEIEQNLQFN